MAETLVESPDGTKKWHWFSIMADLRDQGGLESVVIDPMSVRANHCCGKTFAGTRFLVTWFRDEANHFFMLTMSQEESALVDAFAKVLEYRPFCKYTSQTEGGVAITYEWDKKDPEGRFVAIQKDARKENVQRL